MGVGLWAQAEAQEHSPLPPPPSHSIQAQGGGFIGLLGKLSLNPLRSSDTTDPAHGEAEWTSGEATRFFQPEALCILPASWWANPRAHRKSANPADSTNAPKHMLPAPGRGRETTTQGTRTHAPGDVSAGHQKTAWIFPLSDESAFQTIHPRVYFASV